MFCLVAITFTFPKLSVTSSKRVRGKKRVLGVSNLKCASNPGSVLQKKLTGGSAYFFGSEIFDILIFLGLENLSYFLGLKIFHLFFWGNNFDTIYFWGVRLNDLDLQTHSKNKINE